MDYKARLDRLDAHLAEHPTDYQAVIARLITYSDSVGHERHQRQVERLKKIAECRRKLNEKC